MNKENASKIWKLIQETGDFLKGKLPDHPNHPKGRNPYAHVALEVKNYFGMTYKDIPDEKLNEVINPNSGRDKYFNYLEKLNILNSDVDNFFENVMINDSDEKIKSNRLCFLKNLKKFYSQIADFSFVTKN